MALNECFSYVIIGYQEVVEILRETERKLSNSVENDV